VKLIEAREALKRIQGALEFIYIDAKRAQELIDSFFEKELKAESVNSKIIRIKRELKDGRLDETNPR
jgi:hypothetical protein